MFKKSLLAILLSGAASAYAIPLSSQYALVFEEESGKILFEKNSRAVVPIASLTKLMTAMVVLDAKQDMQEMISIEESDVDTIKHSSSRVPVGTIFPREVAMRLALMSSDNRAAAALGRTYPGGILAFRAAVDKKLAVLGMHDTSIEEPTGLSARNRSSATDLLKMASAASYYPDITRITTETDELIDMNGQPVQYRNTNRLVGKKDWDVLLSKTGYTREAGRCLIMRMQSAGKHVIVVLLNASESGLRLLDAENIRRFLTDQPLQFAKAALRRTTTLGRTTVRKIRSARNTVRFPKVKNASKSQKKSRLS